MPSSLDRRIVRTEVGHESRTLIEYLAARFSYHSESEWRERIINSVITLNGASAAPETPLSAGDVIEYHVADLPEPEVDGNYSIVYEDSDLVAVDKPGNLPCHPAGPFYRHTLWFLLKKRYGDICPVNRLDRETSGLSLWARTPETAKFFSKQLGAMRKRYLVLVHGSFEHAMEAEGFLEPDAGSVVRKKLCFAWESSNPEAKRVCTKFTPLRSGDRLSLIGAELVTGRTHQIRATLFSLGFPVAGDKLYGLDETMYMRQKARALTAADFETLIFPRQALHAWKLFIKLPDGSSLELEAPAPDFFNNF
ncbi:MAG: pseudouridine synthase [Victivallaceae bacterium]|nr:RluA family pseudouridine synthase [Victivallaceae bacterium]